jgi:hypothetical protein
MCLKRTMALAGIGSDTMIKYKNLYNKYKKSGARRERRKRTKVYNGLHCIKTKLLKSII